MIRLNGNETKGYEDVSLEQMLSKEGFDKTRIAVEINGAIVSKRDYAQTIIHAGDVIEVVSFVGGG